ncbi:MAG: hypothetical protein ACMXYE_05590 [Candidatus Woesearchaeota archaeon]
MSFIKWTNERIAKMNYWDIQCIKLAVAGFVLMIAKLWEPLLHLEWYWYALIFVLAMIKPIITVFRK